MARQHFRETNVDSGPTAAGSFPDPTPPPSPPPAVKETSSRSSRHNKVTPWTKPLIFCLILSVLLVLMGAALLFVGLYREEDVHYLATLNITSARTCAIVGGVLGIFGVVGCLFSWWWHGHNKNLNRQNGHA